MKSKQEKIIWSLIGNCNRASAALSIFCDDIDDTYYDFLHKKARKHTCVAAATFKNIYSSLEKLSAEEEACILKNKINALNNCFISQTSNPGFRHVTAINLIKQKYNDIRNELEKISEAATMQYIKITEQKGDVYAVL